MISVRMNSIDLSNKLRNTQKYSLGFLDGIESAKVVLMNRIAEFVSDALGDYIDAQARISPESLHHVYEWGGTGRESSRLFYLRGIATGSLITISGQFLPSSTTSDTATEPFRNKAEVMENQISIVISPKNSDFLVFDDGEETVFTRNSIFIENPGGDAVAGSFGRTVDMFFTQYFTNAILQPFILKLQRADEYLQYFSAGARGGYGVGLKAGQKYINSAGMVLE